MVEKAIWGRSERQTCSRSAEARAEVVLSVPPKRELTKTQPGLYVNGWRVTATPQEVNEIGQGRRLSKGEST